jgi:glycosyltransferase involved in cell wall biosynthesis
MTEKVDVVMLTRNSERWLSECLESVYKNVPVNRLIVIDGYSTDRTLEILGEFNKEHGNVKIIIQNGSRGNARARGIREVSTEWFMFVDSDVVLSEDWFERANRLTANDIGAVWGVDILGDMANKFAVFIFKWMETRVFNIRGGCHDILIRRDCVKDIQIPKHLHTLEDAYIKDWIKTKNYKVIISYDSYCRHYKSMNSLFSKESILPAFFELRNMKLVRERLLFAWIFGFGWFLQEIGFNGKKTVNIKKQYHISHVRE